MENKPSNKFYEEIVGQINFNNRGLITAIAQQYDTHEVLMLAWMNARSLAITLAEEYVCYWSRSRNALWRKGETSGHIQKLIELRVDCDNDAILLLVDQTGPACHTNKRSCFFQALTSEGFMVKDIPI